MDKKFNPKKLEKLNNPDRLKSIPPDYIWKNLNFSECKTIVDIGAGTGLFSIAFSKIMENGTVYALDISSVMIDWMQNNISDYKNIIPMIMSENKVPLKDELSDLVLMITIHHELSDPEDLLLEANRVLKKGGIICILDWKKEEMPFGPSLDIRCSPEEISKQLLSSGFSGIKNDTSLDMFDMVWAQK